MTSSPDLDPWRPRWMYSGDVHAALVVTSTDEGVTTAWVSPAGAAERQFVAAFLRHRLTNLPDKERETEVNFLYVVLRRAPRPGDNPDVMGRASPVAEFGYGGPPASPDEWPLVRPPELLQAAIRWVTVHRADA